ncbi:MAG: alpha-ketoacid dehydrogenase subunit beta [Candidatus Omnitrophica bacterium]|jgi:pyruvate dehydrogenase E1 component beta subunit|nr:alpha-ketoacid dehydrogenase subunit beta [Candidatus Omnitrophota bacterium]
MSWDKVPVDLSDLRVLPEDNTLAGNRLITYRQAIHEAFAIALKQDPKVFLFGEGIDDPAGVFGTTLNLHKQFSKDRVFDTPICENTLTGIAIGASLAGMRPVLIHMRTDFLLVSMDQIINHAAKWKYMFGGKVNLPIVIRAIIGGGWGSAAQHSQPIQAIFAHIPGLRVVMPSTAYDAKGLLLSSIACPDPVMFIDHRWLFDYKDYVPEEAYLVPLGKPVLRRQGKDVTVITSSFMTAIALEAGKKLQDEGIDIEIVDLRTVKPIDAELIFSSVKKTKKAIVLDFGYAFCGISAEISSMITENCFSFLARPVERIALADVPTPASHVLEKEFYPNLENIICKIRKIAKGG